MGTCHDHNTLESRELLSSQRAYPPTSHTVKVSVSVLSELGSYLYFYHPAYMGTHTAWLSVQEGERITEGMVGKKIQFQPPVEIRTKLWVYPKEKGKGGWGDVHPSAQVYHVGYLLPNYEGLRMSSAV